MGEDAERDGDDGNHQNGDRAARPVLFAFAGDEREQQHGADDHDRSDEEDWRLKFGGQIGEHRVDPEEEEVGLGSGLDDGGIGHAGGAEGAEEECARNDGEHE